MLQDAQAEDRAEADAAEFGVEPVEIVGQVQDDVDARAGVHVDADVGAAAGEEGPQILSIAIVFRSRLQVRTVQRRGVLLSRTAVDWGGP